MACTCNCGNYGSGTPGTPGNGFSTRVNCYGNEFAELGPYYPYYNYNRYGFFPNGIGNPGLSYVKSQLLLYAAADISKAIHDLETLLTTNTSVITTVETQKGLIITALETYNKPVTTVQTVFDRDNAIDPLLTPISTALASLSTDPNYQEYLTQFIVLQTALENYFELATSTT